MNSDVLTLLRSDERLGPYFQVDPETGCWLWTRSTTADGYGQSRVGGRFVYAHRRAYEVAIGPVPAGLELDHLCRVRSCVNPSHLEPVTHRENQLRGETIGGINARKTHCAQGHPFDDANTYIHARGGRQCRACMRAHQARRRAAARGETPR